MNITIDLPLTPVPKARPRLTRKGHVYTPRKTKVFEQAVSMHTKASLIQHGISHPLNTGISLEVEFVFDRPKRFPKSKPERQLKSSRPDLDNLIKSLSDGLQGVLFKDDGQIHSIHASKVYGSLDESAHIKLKVNVH